MSYSVNSQAIILFRIAWWRTTENCPLIILKYPHLFYCVTFLRLRQIQEVLVPILIEFSHLFLISHSTTKPTKWTVHPAKTQFSLSIHPVWSVFAVYSVGSWEPKVSSCGKTKYSDQTGQMPKLVWIFAERTSHLMILSRCDSCEE